MPLVDVDCVVDAFDPRLYPSVQYTHALDYTPVVLYPRRIIYPLDCVTLSLDCFLWALGYCISLPSGFSCVVYLWSISAAELTTLRHSGFPRHSVRIKCVHDICDPSVE